MEEPHVSIQFPSRKHHISELAEIYESYWKCNQNLTPDNWYTIHPLTLPPIKGNYMPRNCDKICGIQSLSTLILQLNSATVLLHLWFVKSSSLHTMSRPPWKTRFEALFPPLFFLLMIRHRGEVKGMGVACPRFPVA